MALKNQMTEILGIEFPMIMAPMFLVSNEAMVNAAMEAGIMGTFPTLNYRNKGEYEEVLKRINAYRDAHNVSGSYGVNIIVQRTNPLLEEHLEASVRQKVPFYITSLGSPKEVIERAHSYGAKVFCDVTNVDHARLCVDLGCDGIIAVGQGAGGHAGPYPLQLLVPALRKAFPSTPIVSAGGVATGEGIVSMLALGASGVSVGTRFIACHETEVGDGYKNAIVDHGMKDIVMTDKISGTPCTIIHTPYAQQIGLKQNWFERKLATNKRTKKYFKLFVQLRGMKRLENALQPASYKTLWCAGQSVEMIDEVLSVKEIVAKMERETWETLHRLEGLRSAASVAV